MNKFTYSILSISICLSAQSAVAQTNVTTTPQETNKSKQLQAQDPSSYVPGDDAYALPWAPIKMSNVVFEKHVWRTIDVSDSHNSVFGATTGKTFADLLVKAAFDSKVKVYDPNTPAFCTKQLSKDDLIALITPGAHADKKCFVPGAVTRYCIKEDWLFLRAENKMVVRILSIAPLMEVKGTDGATSEQPAFWLYYPESRNYLASVNFTDANGETTNWDKVFQYRDFASRITKVTGGQLSPATSR